MWTLQKSPAHGAYCSLYVATDPSLEGVSGEYFAQSRLAAVGPAVDKNAAKKLWEISCKLSGIVDN